MTFDINTPSPDDGHEAIRVAVVQAIEDAASNASGVDDAYWLTSTLFDLIGSLLSANDALTARVDALEAAAAPPIAPTPEVSP